MKPVDVHRVMKGIGANNLYHANTVTTSYIFLEQGGLLSRRFVEDNGLVQTSQNSDSGDKKYGIWDRIFLDHVDIHYRGGRAKGPNKYGPVLFIVDLDVLLALPKGTDILITRKNPANWVVDESDDKRWFHSLDELAQNIRPGNFDKMLVIKTQSTTLDFPNRQVRILLDDPKRKVSSGRDAYAHAEKRLKGAAASGNVKISIEKHRCRDDCSCVEVYAKYTAQFFDSRFA